MNVKIDTKEKFHVITIIQPSISANMTEEIREKLNEVTENHVKHIVLNLAPVEKIDQAVAVFIAEQQQNAYEQGRSFVICGMQQAVKDVFKEADLLDILNYTPTESEAWDIVQMEEVERELLGGEE
ncbi:anti-anti-sigma factor [Terrimonas sp.]|uniref:STAS domain-containing protein n=1 Tax=Terrimonas sp. TaxID=1914338 RepID=UPI000D522E4D|nr:STAS domain-containing protein [Terrimonas sp.]PVD49762.1 anti-anti-sigma factor [Terrimonas sp.]